METTRMTYEEALEALSLGLPTPGWVVQEEEEGASCSLQPAVQSAGGEDFDARR